MSEVLPDWPLTVTSVVSPGLSGNAEVGVGVGVGVGAGVMVDVAESVGTLGNNRLVCCDWRDRAAGGSLLCTPGYQNEKNQGDCKKQRDFHTVTVLLHGINSCMNSGIYSSPFIHEYGSGNMVPDVSGITVSIPAAHESEDNFIKNSGKNQPLILFLTIDWTKST